MLTFSQIAWASRHDWFVCDHNDGSISVIDCYVEDGVLHSRRIRWRKSFGKLKAWAGY